MGANDKINEQRQPHEPNLQFAIAAKKLFIQISLYMEIPKDEKYIRFHESRWKQIGYAANEVKYLLELYDIDPNRINKFCKELENYPIKAYIPELEILKEFIAKADKRENITKQLFDDNVLSKIHDVFKEDIWEKISLEDFLRSFKGKKKLIKPKVQADFCYLLGLMEVKRNEDSCINYAEWVEATFNIKQNSYKKQKNSKERVSIKSKFDSLLI